MNFKHTPGPWIWITDNCLWSNGADCEILEAGDDGKPYGMHSGKIDHHYDFETKEANKALIAAAPDLLEALDQLLIDMVIAQGNMRDAAKNDPRWEGCSEIIQPRVDAALAAITKATGGQ